jgi:site-specific DNA-methyltransferase (adenine-specific)
MNTDKQIQLYLGNCKDVLKKIEDNSIDFLLCDPPYGYSFMGKDWDKVVIPSSTWKECLRVLKPGAFAFIMSAPRQDVLGRMIYNLQEAGFETGFTSIYWAYASGFPKAINISKAIDKRKGLKGKVIGKGQRGSPDTHKSAYQMANQGEDNSFGGTYDITEPESGEAKQLNGFYGGFQPKPAVEIILVVMKPLSEKSYIDQALKNDKGITNLDDCRIPYTSEIDKSQATPQGKCTSKDVHTGAEPDAGNDEERIEFERPGQKGRFPANLLVSDDVLNDGKERTSGTNCVRNKPGTFIEHCYGDEGVKQITYGDSGSFSRYFDLDAWTKENNINEDNNTFPFLICPKASKSEKNKGLDNLPKKQKIFNRQSNNSSKDIKDVEERFTAEASANFHPTVKPIKLMSYLITLGSRKGDTVLDCFLGSGTTGVAAKLLSRKFIGIELSEDYLKIAQERIKGVKNV